MLEVVVELVVVVLVVLKIVVVEEVGFTHSSFRQVFSSGHPHLLHWGISLPCRQ